METAEQPNWDTIEQRALEVTFENLAIVREQKAQMLKLLEQAACLVPVESYWLADYEAWKSQNFLQEESL